MIWLGKELIGEVKVEFTSQIVRGVENTGMPSLGYFALFLLYMYFEQHLVDSLTEHSDGMSILPL